MTKPVNLPKLPSFSDSLIHYSKPELIDKIRHLENRIEHSQKANVFYLSQYQKRHMGLMHQTAMLADAHERIADQQKRIKELEAQNATFQRQ